MLDPIQAQAFLLKDAGLSSMGSPSGPTPAPKGRSFSDTLSSLIKETSQLEKTADQTLADFSTGKVENLHDVMLSMTKADLSFQMLLEVRSKLVDAYTEVMRMQA